MNWSALQWTVLMVACFMSLAYMYCYNCTVPVQDQFMNEYDLSQLQYNLLFSVMTWPTIILCLFGGIISDKIGVNKMMILSYLLAIISHILFVVGCIKQISFNFIVMAIGRSLYGGFAEIWTVVRKAFLCEFFDKNEISFAMSTNIAFAALANIALFSIIFELYNLYGIIFAFISGILLLIISILLLIALIIYINYYRNDRSHRTSLPIDEMGDNLLPDSDDKDDFNLITFAKHIWFDIKKWDVRYWLITLILVLYSGITMSWMNIASSFIHSTYDYSYSKANTLILIVWIIAIVTTPIFGYIVDVNGKRCQCLILSGILLTVTHCIFSKLIDNIFDIDIDKDLELCLVIIALSFIGVVTGLFQVCTWPVIMLVVDKKTISTAYGMCTSIQNGALAIFPLMVAVLSKENDSGEDEYVNVEYFLIVTSIFSTVVCVVLWIIDKAKYQNSLDISYDIIHE